MCGSDEDFIGNPNKVEYVTDDELEYEDGDGDEVGAVLLWYGDEEDEDDGWAFNFNEHYDNDEDYNPLDDEDDDDDEDIADNEDQDLRLRFVDGRYVEVGGADEPQPQLEEASAVVEAAGTTETNQDTAMLTDNVVVVVKSVSEEMISEQAEHSNAES